MRAWEWALLGLGIWLGVITFLICLCMAAGRR